jgi:molecular chaperone GrpE (heat shock protein)
VTDSEKASLDRIGSELGELRSLVQSLGAADKSREDKAFDQLYEELRQYKDDFLFQSEKPLLLDLLLFYDSLNWFQESLIKQEMSPDVIADSFQYLIDEFLEVLYRRDVLPMEASETFDRKVHKAVKAIDTDDESEHARITQTLKRGFTRAEKILRPEEVVIMRYRGGKGS